MEAVLTVLRWVRRFVGYEAKPVKVQLHTTTATCGDDVLLCSIELTEPSSTFKDYYENKISVISIDGNAEAVEDCVFKIDEVNSQKLDVYCEAHRAGSAKVRLDLGKWFSFAEKEQDIRVEMSPPDPEQLNDVRFTADGAVDESFSADPKVMYRKQWSLLEADIVDRYENVVEKLGNDHNICLELFNDGGKKMEMEYRDVKIQNGRLGVRVKINEVAKHNLLVTLTSKSIPDQEFRLKEIQIQVNDAPCYLAGSTFRYPDTCVAGKEFHFEILPVDVFGCPLPANSTTDYNSTLEILDSSLLSRNKETIRSKIIKNESNILIFFYTIVLTKSGRRKLMIFDKDNEPKQISFEVNPDENDVHWELTDTPTRTAYKREDLMLTIGLLDRFNNEVRIDSSENVPDLLKQTGPDGLHCSGKLIENNTWKIQYHFKQTGTYDLCLADMKGKSLDGTSFTIIVQDAPLDPKHSSVAWLPRYDDIPDQPVFPEDESFQCRLNLKDILGYNYDTQIPQERFEVRYGSITVKNITISAPANEIGSYVIVVPLLDLLNFEKVNPSPSFRCFVNGVKIENPLVLHTFVGFKQYNVEDCFVVLTRKSREFLDTACRYVQESDMVAKKIGIYVPAYYKKEEIENKIRECRNILQHLLKAIYYRKEAFDADEARGVWKDRASNHYKTKKGGRAEFCSKIKEKYANVMRRYHNLACEEFSVFFNAERGQNVIDLHGLLVADETNLQLYEQQLYERGKSNTEVDTKIKEQREHGDEAIRKLRERLDEHDIRKAKEEGEPWLEIIVGAGIHSENERQRIRPKVEDFLSKNLYKFEPVNKGALVVTFETYSGTEPCFGEYYCNKCHHTWPSGRSWIGKWQACYRCHKNGNSLQKCYPLKQRIRKSQARNPKNVPRRQESNIPHNQKLCEKCVELGRMCPSPRY